MQIFDKFHANNSSSEEMNLQVSHKMSLNINKLTILQHLKFVFPERNEDKLSSSNLKMHNNSQGNPLETRIALKTSAPKLLHNSLLLNKNRFIIRIEQRRKKKH
ncbi:CLUMA_CG005647, isoform A [Clunio marinus]|uniref:CLUMA_CG005647, isoform A n=1 Tax=Clunio marinus TaxID=568069 RepID=A0A1J1HVQ8_9DIPT|nr:CLUMA_CG005647, isoform A [Clunio marinus]